MRLFEAILDANHRALAGDAHAGLHPADFAEELPIIALTCIDPRLNLLMPSVLGVPGEYFIWLRNAGNIITSPLSSTMRSLALACAVKGGKEIAIIGHTDCLVAKTTSMQLIERFRELGIDRSRLPENLNDYFGTFASERANVIKAAETVRQSPLIGPQIPVHGLLVNIETGNLEWLVNGYQQLEMKNAQVKGAQSMLGAADSIGSFNIGEIKFPESKIGEAGATTEELLTHQNQPLQSQPPFAPPVVKPAAPPKLPLPPPIRPRINLHKR